MKDKKRREKKRNKRTRSDSIISADDNDHNDSPTTAKIIKADVGTSTEGRDDTNKKLLAVEDQDPNAKQRGKKQKKKKSKGNEEKHKFANPIENINQDTKCITQETTINDAANDDDDDDGSNMESAKLKKKKRKGTDDDKAIKSKKDKTSSSRDERKKEKAVWLQKIPLVDEKTGKAFSKIQIRRMLKRVKKELPALLTEEEERKLEKERRQAKELDEKEFQKFMEDPEEEDVDEEREEVDEEEEEDGNEKGGNEQLQASSYGKEEDSTLPSKKMSSKPRSKPIPSDYVCQACKNTHKPPHWIYDCPQKVTVRGTNQIAKPLRGHIEPDTQHKVFVSGLPFGVTHKAVEDFFRERCCSTNSSEHLLNTDEPSDAENKKKKAITCKLIRFSDSGKCRGQAYVTFETEEMTNEALKLDGIHWPTTQQPNDEEEKGAKRWLSITRMKSKIETKKIARQRKWRERMKQQGALNKRKNIQS